MFIVLHTHPQSILCSISFFFFFLKSVLRSKTRLYSEFTVKVDSIPPHVISNKRAIT